MVQFVYCQCQHWYWEVIIIKTAGHCPELKSPDYRDGSMMKIICKLAPLMYNQTFCETRRVDIKLCHWFL